MKFVWLMLAAFAEPQGLRVPAGLDAYIPVPETNPITKESVQLGRKLFFDKRLSRDNTVSCATCHDPQYAFTDARKLAVGVDGRTGDNRVPRILNRAYGKAFFWDGRVSQLEEQVVMPIANPKEMDLDVKEAAARVGLDAVTLQRALASYVRTILSGNSPYDRYVQGDRDALTSEQKLGSRYFAERRDADRAILGRTLRTSASTIRGSGRRMSLATSRRRAIPAIAAHSKHRAFVMSRALRPICTTAVLQRLTR